MKGPELKVTSNAENGPSKIRFSNRTRLPLELYSGRNKCSTVGAHISDLKPLRVPSSPLRPRRPVHQSPEVSKPDAGIRTSRHHVATGQWSRTKGALARGDQHRAISHFGQWLVNGESLLLWLMVNSTTRCEHIV